MGDDNFENKWHTTFTVGARLAAPFGGWAPQATPLHPIFILTRRTPYPLNPLGGQYVALLGDVFLAWRERWNLASGKMVAGWPQEAKSHAAADPAATVDQGAQPEPQQPAQYVDACFFCGGAKGPYNLVTVPIHRWELEEIQRRLAAAVPGG